MANGLAVPARSRGKKKISPKTRQEVIERDGLYCRHCGHGPMAVKWGVTPKGTVRLYNDWATLEDRTIELDHIIPESRGGSTKPENLVVFCGDCNRRKWNRDLYTVLLAPVPLSFLQKPSREELGWLPPVVKIQGRVLKAVAV